MYTPYIQIMSIEAVEQLMADTEDAIEYEQEVSRMLSANLSPVSEEEVLKEFEALEKAALVEPGAAPVEPAAATAAAGKPEQQQEAAAAGAAEAGEKPLLELPAVPTHALPTVVPAGPGKDGAVIEEAPEEEQEEARRLAREKVAVMTG